MNKNKLNEILTFLLKILFEIFHLKHEEAKININPVNYIIKEKI